MLLQVWKALRNLHVYPSFPIFFYKDVFLYFHLWKCNYGFDFKGTLKSSLTFSYVMLTVHPVMIARCLVYDDRNTSWLLNKKWVLSLSVCVYASVHAWVHMWVCACMHAVCVCVWLHACHGTCVAVREQLEELSYCHPTNGSLGLNSGH